MDFDLAVPMSTSLTRSGETFPVNTHGCWQNPDAVPGGNYGWNVADCASETARVPGRRVFGYGGGRCRIPDGNTVSARQIKTRSGQPVSAPGMCDITGTANSVNIMELPDEAYALLRRQLGVGDEILAVNFDGETVTGTGAGPGGGPRTVASVRG